MTRMSSLHLVRTPISIMIEGSADGSIEVAITPGMRQTLWYNNNNPFHVQISMTISNKKKKFCPFRLLHCHGTHSSRFLSSIPSNFLLSRVRTILES